MILVDHLQKRSLRARPANIVLGRPRVAMSASHRVYVGGWTADPRCARIEDLLTERPTLGIPRSCHNA